MNRFAVRTVMVVAVAAIAAVGAAGVASAQAGNAAAQTGTQATPKNFNYEIKDGKRVPKAERKVNPDGSWREERRQGTCVTVKEKTPSGEYKESRRCD